MKVLVTIFRKQCLSIFVKSLSACKTHYFYLIRSRYISIFFKPKLTLLLGLTQIIIEFSRVTNSKTKIDKSKPVFFPFCNKLLLFLVLLLPVRLFHTITKKRNGSIFVFYNYCYHNDYIGLFCAYCVRKEYLVFLHGLCFLPLTLLVRRLRLLPSPSFD